MRLRPHVRRRDRRSGQHGHRRRALPAGFQHGDHSGRQTDRRRAGARLLRPHRTFGHVAVLAPAGHARTARMGPLQGPDPRPDAERMHVPCRRLHRLVRRDLDLPAGLSRRGEHQHPAPDPHGAGSERPEHGHHAQLALLGIRRPDTVRHERSGQTADDDARGPGDERRDVRVRQNQRRQQDTGHRQRQLLLLLRRVRGERQALDAGLCQEHGHDGRHGGFLLQYHGVDQRRGSRPPREGGGHEKYE